MFYLLFLQSNDDIASAILFQTSFLNGLGALFQDLDGSDLAGRNYRTKNIWDKLNLSHVLLIMGR